MTFRIPSPAEQETYAEIVAQSFGVEPPDALTWVRGLGIENNRVLFEDGELVGGLVRYQAGQWFGGRRLPMVGIAGVSIDPARRGRGFATRLMRDLVVRPETPEDRAAIEELHRRHGARNPGTVDRSAPLWSRIRTPRNRPAHRGHLIEGPNGLEGYCFLVACKLPTGRQELLVSDFVVETERAARRLLTFFGDHASLADEVVFHGSASDPLLALLPEQRNLITLNEFWMLRILDLRGALEGRGYPEHVTARLELEVADDCLPANAGRFVLDVAEGKAQVRPGGSGKLRMHVRGLAALYSGFRSPTDLVFLGLAEGEPRELALAASLFAGPPPAMRDFF